MRTNVMKTSGWALAFAASLALVGCGPKGGGGGGGGGTGDGPPPDTGSGMTADERAKAGLPAPVVDAATKERFDKVVAKHEAARKDGSFTSKCDGIAREYEGVFKKDPKFLDAYYNKGATLAECGKNDEAEAIFREMVKKYSGYGRAYVGVGTVLHKKGDLSSAREWYERGLKIEPRVVEGNINMATLIFLDYKRTKDKEKLKEAVTNIRRALAIDATSLAAYATFAYIYYELGQLRLASLVCQQAKKYDENYAPVWNVLGLIELANGNVTAALNHFKTAADKDPNYVPALVNWGSITLNYRDYDTAISKLERALEIGGDDYEAYLTLGVAYRGKGTSMEDDAERKSWLNKSKSAYEKASKLDSGAADPYFNLAVLHHYYDVTADKKSDLNKAIGYYGTFISKVNSLASIKDKEKKKVVKDAEDRRKKASDYLKVL